MAYETVVTIKVIVTGGYRSSVTDTAGRVRNEAMKHFPHMNGVVSVSTDIEEKE